VRGKLHDRGDDRGPIATQDIGIISSCDAGLRLLTGVDNADRIDLDAILGQCPRRALRVIPAFANEFASVGDQVTNQVASLHGRRVTCSYVEPAADFASCLFISIASESASRRLTFGDTA
jgi:hypothetical protein